MTKKIELANRKGFALVDDEDYEQLAKHKWCKNSAGYAMRTRKMSDIISGAKIYMHRYILGLQPGDKLQCDHINGDRLDNRRDNLRVATNQQNHWNKPKASGKYTSQYKGVHWSKEQRNWISSIHINGKTQYIGTFIDELDAARAYDAAARELFGEYAHLNFPDTRHEPQTQVRRKPKNKHWGVKECRKGRWHVRIGHNGKYIHVGVFDSETDAAMAYDKAALKYHGKRAKLNFPNE